MQLQTRRVRGRASQLDSGVGENGGWIGEGLFALNTGGLVEEEKLMGEISPQAHPSHYTSFVYIDSKRQCLS